MTNEGRSGHLRAAASLSFSSLTAERLAVLRLPTSYKPAEGRSTVIGCACNLRLHPRGAVSNYDPGTGRYAREFAMRSLFEWVEAGRSRFFFFIVIHTTIVVGLLTLVASQGPPLMSAAYSVQSFDTHRR